MKSYAASQFCDMVGVPYSSLRYYERIGLLKPRKNQFNNYREYTHFDAFLLNRFKYYRALGFDVEKTLEIVNSSDRNIILTNLENKEKNIETEIDLLKHRLNSIKETKDRINRIKSERNKYEIQYVNTKLFLAASKGLDFGLSDFNIFSKYVDLLPITTYCSRIKKALVEGGEGIVRDYGMSISLDNIDRLDNECLQGSEIIGLGKCLTYIVTRPNSNYNEWDILREPLEYMKEQNYSLNGDMYFEGIRVKNEEGLVSHIIFIPIK